MTKKLHKKELRQVKRWVTAWARHPYRSWKWHDHRYGMIWRIGNALAALLIIIGIVIPIAEQFYQNDRYQLSSSTLKLVGQTNADLLNQLTYDTTSQTYQFNKAAVTTSSLPTEVQKASVGTPGSEDSSTYALDVPEDFTKGVTYHDINSQLGFSLIPKFQAMSGKNVNGHLVYPLDGANQAIYTLKNNGLKEDIVVPTATSDSMNFSYTLQLPKTLEARIIPDSGGAIGVYSADPSLFGNITYGSDADEARVEQARENGAKTNLIFGLPAPTIKTIEGGPIGKASARFELNGNNLSVVAEHLSDVHTPITIDPSVVVTSTSDFQTKGNNEGMIDFSTSGQISRGGLTGGSFSSWNSGNSFTSARQGTTTVAYNGYLYVLGGEAGSFYSDVQYAPINGNGTLGTWHYTHNSTDDGTTFVAGFTNARAFAKAVAYNGYLYITGGNSTGYNTSYNDVQYAPINSNGTIGTWNSTSSFTGIRADHAVTAFDGYMYVSGGDSLTINYSDVQYAPINGNGTLGTWHYTHNSTDDGTTFVAGFTNARDGQVMTAYNNFLYIVGGVTSHPSNTFRNDVQYAPINSNGTIGTWNSTSSFTTARGDQAGMIYNGYLYVIGGNNGTPLSDTQYAPIYANGTLGVWTTSTAMSDVRYSSGYAAYNGYVYITGGTGVGTSQYATTFYGKISPAGQITSFTSITPTNKFTARASTCTTAYNGYLYAIGGSSDDNFADITTVYYSPISSNGTIGNWASTSALPASNATADAGCVAYNGYMYLVGGQFDGTAATNKTRYAVINSNGTLGAWATTTILPDSVAFHPNVFVYGNNIYCIGGFQQNGDGTLSFHAPLNSNGTIGTWVTDTNVMLNLHISGGTARVGKYVYAIAGSTDRTSTNGQNIVEYAAINSDGSIGTWATTTVYPAATSFLTATVVNGCIYAMGGENISGTSQSGAYYTCPNGDGTISSWQTAPSLTAGTTDLMATSYNGVIYAVAGYTTVVLQSTQYAFVNNGGSGSPGSWTETSNFTCQRRYLSSVAYNGYLYVAGGDCSGVMKSDIQYAPISTDGSIGNFTTDTHAFTTGRKLFGLVAYNGYMYVTAGTNVSDTVTYKDVQYAPIGSSGALTANWASAGAGSNFDTTGRYAPCVYAYNGYMYVSGGWDLTSDHADTRYAQINSDGTLGSWADSGHNFSDGRSDMSCFVANGYVYLLGGNGTTIHNDVQSAPINSNGTLGAWTTTTSFHGIRQDFAVGVSNGFAYIMGGTPDDGPTLLGDTQFAAINANGTLGEWQIAKNTFASPVYGNAGFAYKDNLYTNGGNEANGGDDINYAPINAINRIGTYSKLIDLTGGVNVSGITYNGTLPNGMNAISYRYAGTNGVFGSSAAANTIASTGACTGNLTNTRYLWVTLTLDDSNIGSDVFSDTAGTPANTTDFTVTYLTQHPPPNIRLRGGQTLQTGSLSALDTCGV